MTFVTRGTLSRTASLAEELASDPLAASTWIDGDVAEKCTSTLGVSLDECEPGQRARFGVVEVRPGDEPMQLGLPRPLLRRIPPQARRPVRQSLLLVGIGKVRREELVVDSFEQRLIACLELLRITRLPKVPKLQKVGADDVSPQRHPEVATMLETALAHRCPFAVVRGSAPGSSQNIKHTSTLKERKLPSVPFATQGPTRLAPWMLNRKPLPVLITVHFIPERRDWQRKRPAVTRVP